MAGPEPQTRLGPFTRSAQTPTAAAAAAQPAECASLWRGAGRARARASRPAGRRRACVNACAPPPAPSWCSGSFSSSRTAETRAGRTSTGVGRSKEAGQVREFRNYQKQGLLILEMRKLKPRRWK